MIAHAGEWEVRQFATSDSKFASFAQRGFLHLQLWSPVKQASVLTPSRLTRGLFDVWLDEATLLRARRWTLVRAAMTDVVPLPSTAELRALERWFIRRHEPPALRPLRTWWDEQPRASSRAITQRER